MKKDLAEVKAYAEAMVDSNRARDTYVNKEQDKFFRRVNRQRANIDALKERMERLELRARVLGSAILPPSRVPEQNPRTPYVVHTYSSFVSDRFLPRFRTYLSVPYITLFHLLHFRSPVD